MPRRKQQSIHVPADENEARTMIGEYVDLERSIALEELSAEEAIAAVKRQRDDAIAELRSEGSALFDGLKAWWEAGGKNSVAIKRRSAEFGGATIGIRLTPPKVTFARKVTAASIVEWLKSLRWIRKGEFLRHPKTQLDKDAIIKAVRADPAIAEKFAGQGVTVEQVDEFFIDTGIDREELKKETAAAA